MDKVFKSREEALEYMYSLPDYSTDSNDSNEDDDDEDTVNENFPATFQDSYGHDTDLDDISMNEPNISPLTRYQSVRKRKQEKSDERKKIPKTSRKTRQSTNSSLVPDLTGICDSDDDIVDPDDDVVDPDFVLSAVESDDETIIQSDDDTIIDHDNEIVSDPDDSISDNRWHSKFQKNTLPSFSQKAKLNNSFTDEDRLVLFFQRFFYENLIHHIVKETNLYAIQIGVKNWNPTNAVEIKAYISMLIFMGIHKVPHLDHYWSSNPALHVQSIAGVITCKRVKKIRQCLHCNDNSQAKNCGDTNFDKLYKIRPIIEMLNKKFISECSPSHWQSVDECMVLFKGRSSLKQYMPKKPTKRGYKIWARADATTGYLCQFEIYTGKDNAKQGNLGETVVKKMCSEIKNSGSLIVFDNFFTSVQLLEDLENLGLHGCGTVRSDRKGLPDFMRKKNKLEKGEHLWKTKNKISAIQ